jgi:hypothetical protein
MMKKHITIIAATVMALSVLTACGTQTGTTETDTTTVADTADTNSENAPEQPGDNGEHIKQNRVSAQVTAIDGSNVTLKLATEPDGEPQGNPENGDKIEMPEMTFDGEEVAVEITDGMLKSMDMPEPNGEQPLPGAQPQGEKPDGEQPQGEKPDGEKPDSEQPQGEKPDGEQPQGEKPDGEQPQKPDGAQPQGEKPDGNFEDNLEDLDISELAVDDVVNVIYDEDGTTIKYIIKENR